MAAGIALTASDIFDRLADSAGLALPIFSLLAVITSLLGVGLGCVDFAEDAMATGDKENDGRCNAVAATFFPCLGFALYFPGAFLPALKFSGIFRQLLFGAVPVLMVIRGRQQTKANTGRAWKDQLVLRRAKSWKEGEAAEAAMKLEILPFGSWGVSSVAIITALLVVLELNHIISR